MLLDDIKDGPSDGLCLLRWGFELYRFHLRFGFPPNKPYRRSKHVDAFCFPELFSVCYRDTHCLKRRVRATKKYISLVKGAKPES